jgi:hypothetical protein
MNEFKSTNLNSCMDPVPAYTPIPLIAIAALRSLTGDEFKAIAALCYASFNQQQSQLTVEQLVGLSGIAPHQIKPILHRLSRRGWVLQVGLLYQLTQPPIEGSEPFNPALGIRPARVNMQSLYPEGPWLTERGLLDEQFVRDRAEVWQKGNHSHAQSFGQMAIEDVMGAVCKYYAKPANHGSLEIDWQSYCAKHQRYLQNVQQRIQAGVEIEATEQTAILQKLPIVLQESQPIYESPLLNGSLSEFSQYESSQYESPRFLSQQEPLHAESALVPEALVPDALVPDAQIPKVLMQRALASSGDRWTETRPSRPPMDKIEQVRLWLSDPVLRSEGVRKAQHFGYTLIYNDCGVAIGAEDPQFDAATEF